MPPLFPPEYPERPDAPLLSFGPSFSEEISRSVILAIWHDVDENPIQAEVRIAAALTMFEGFHPRDHLECMLAAQGVAAHAMIMECYRRAMLRDTPEVVAIKLRSNVSQLSRTFSTLLHDLERRQSKPLMQRPSRPPDAPPKGEPPVGGPFAEEPPDDTPDMPEDVALRPDGTPGTLAAYAPKPPPEPVVIPREAPIMVALASRPKPWRQVNGESSATPSAEAPPVEAPPDGPKSMRGPVDVTEKHLGGDAWARFASARLDPNAPDEPLRFDHEDSVVELELISTGGDPDAEAERAALIAAHPEGKPIITIRYGTNTTPKETADDD
jgi:hypothetical protein